MKLHIIIPKANLRKEFGWLYDQWGEHAVKTCIVKHPEIQSLIDNDLVLFGVGELYFYPLEKHIIEVKGLTKIIDNKVRNLRDGLIEKEEYQ